jgi:hypothetical protein
MTRNELILKAEQAGWTRSSYLGDMTLIRKVPLKTRDTYYTQVFRSNDTTLEHIAIINLQYCGKNSRVWKSLKK